MQAAEPRVLDTVSTGNVDNAQDLADTAVPPQEICQLQQDQESMFPVQETPLVKSSVSMDTSVASSGSELDPESESE